MIAHYIIWATLLAVAVLKLSNATTADEDFAFDMTDDFEIEFSASDKKILKIRDVTAKVGQLFHLTLPKNVFEENDVVKYEVRKQSVE